MHALKAGSIHDYNLLITFPFVAQLNSLNTIRPHTHSASINLLPKKQQLISQYQYHAAFFCFLSYNFLIKYTLTTFSFQ